MILRSDKLLALCREKLTKQDELKHLQWRLLQYPDADLSDNGDLTRSTTSLAGELRQSIMQFEQDLSDLEHQMDDLAREILAAPTCLLPLPDHRRAYTFHVAKVRDALDSSNIDIDLTLADIVRAEELLKSDLDVTPLDIAVVALLKAAFLNTVNMHEKAREPLSQAMKYLPPIHQIHWLVVKLVYTNTHKKRTDSKFFEARNAYSDALCRVQGLGRTQAIAGNSAEAELYRYLEFCIKTEIERRFSTSPEVEENPVRMADL